MRLVPIGSIKEGTVLGRIVYDEHNRILLNQGVELTSTLIQRLKENGILCIYIHDSYSTAEIKDVITPELRGKAVQEIHHVFSSVRKQVEQSIKSLNQDKTQLTKKLNLKADQKYFEHLDSVINDMIDEITYNREAMIGLVDIKNMKTFVYQHSIQVTVLSLLIGASMKMNKSQLKELAISAMLHDIGLTFIDKELVIYKDSFSEEQKEAYRSHCQLGNDFVKSNTALSTHVRMGILQHHEEYSGLGFPLGLEGDHIHQNARIIAVANDYDKMSAGLDGVIIPPNEIIEYIMGNSGRERKYDIDITRHFVRRIIPFPIGSLVLLSNDRKAVVSGYNQSQPLRPIVKLLEKDKVPTQLEIFDLMDLDKLNVTIIKTLYEV